MSSASLPAVSVILPTHNRLDLFRRSLASVLGQTFRDLEVIVVDNACSDGTAAFLDSVDDARLRRLRVDTLLGASAARNFALKSARAALLAFQDDDDIWLPDKLERQVRQLESAGAGCGLCLCGYVRLVAGGVEMRYQESYFREIDFSRGLGALNSSVIATPGWLLRRSALDRAGPFDAQLPARNDWELALRLSDVCTFTYVAGPLFIQDQTRPTTMHRNEIAYGRALKRIVAIHGQRWVSDPRVGARHAEIIGRAESTFGDVREGRSWLLASLRQRPLQPRVWGLLLASLLGPQRLGRLRRWKRGEA